MLAPLRTHVRRRGCMPTCMSSEVDDDGGTGRKLTGKRRPRERREDDNGDEPSQTATMRPWARGGLRR